MSIELIDKIKPKNGGSFPLLDAEDVQMPNGQRLSAYRATGAAHTKVVAAEQELTFGETYGVQVSEGLVLTEQLMVGNTYKVVWGGVEYVCACYAKAEGGGMVMEGALLGNANVFLSAMPDTGEPFYIGVNDSGASVAKRADDTTDTIAIYGESGGVSSWNDLTDKPFYEEGSTEELLEETKFEGFIQNPTLGLYYLVADAPLSLVPGETYIVNWDGEEYVCVAEDASAIYGSEMTMIGNAAAFGLSGNNEPFIVGTDATKIYYYAADPADSSVSHTIGISQSTVVVKPLDAKYLPMDAIDARIEAKLAEIPDVSEVGM